jgi:Transposase IS116/IS110/IS902 family
VHAVLADRGIGQDRGLWTGPGRAWLASLELPPTARAIVEDCCGLLDALATPIARLERQIAGLAKPDPRVQALQVLPGIGRLTAMTLVAEIGDIRRFPSARKLCAWAGLTPTVRNLRPQGPPRPHHQDGMWDLPGTAVGGLRYGRGALEPWRSPWPVRFQELEEVP